MRYDVHILSTDNFIPEEIVLQDIPGHYFVRENGDFLMASTILNSEDEIIHLVRFLFQNPPTPPEIYRNEFAYILDLTAFRDRLIGFDYLEEHFEREHFERWITLTGRETSMTEYGLLIDFIGFTRQAFDKKNCLLIISKERYMKLT
jgi:hypothetical protein